MSDQDTIQQTDISLLAEMRHKHIFCDAVLKVQNEEFWVHKVILCGSSSYFRAMFERWDHHHSRIFPIDGLSSNTMSMLLDFTYEKPVTLSERDIQALILAADMFLVEDLVKACFEQLEHHLCPENCIGIWKFSDIVLSPRTRNLAWRHILDNFEEVTSGEEFLELTAQELISIIEVDDLNVKKESVVFEAIVKWTKHELNKRKGEFPQLFTKVRVSQIPIDYIRMNIAPHALMDNNYDCINTLANALEAAYDIAVHRVYRNPLVRPRLPGAILLAIGGWSGGDPTNGIEAYDYRADRWIDVTNYQERPRAYHGSVFLNGSVYCVGGFDRMEHFNSMRRLDLSTRTWHEMPPMYHRRCYVSTTVLSDCIYAMGGYNGQIRSNTAEVYNPKTNQWSLIAPMNEARSDANCATLNGKIYICGGFNGSECLQTAECYSPETNEWSDIAPMTTRRSGVAVIAFADLIFAVGGFDGNVRLRSVEAYNPRTNRWREVASMNTSRSNFGIEVVDDRIFAVGGFNGFTTTYNVESYDFQSDTWTAVCDMSIFRSALNCCVISGLPNMSDYTIARDALPLVDIEEESDLDEPN